MKRCCVCKVEKPVEGFYKTSTECKACNKIRDSGSRRQQKRDYAWRKKLETDFGMTPEDYWQLFAEQEGRCAICRREPDWKRLAVDHDHQTGLVRGLLCHQCNCGLGFFNDDFELLATALGYLKA